MRVDTMTDDELQALADTVQAELIRRDNDLRSAEIRDELQARDPVELQRRIAVATKLGITLMELSRKESGHPYSVRLSIGDDGEVYEHTNYGMSPYEMYRQKRLTGPGAPVQLFDGTVGEYFQAPRGAL